MRGSNNSKKGMEYEPTKEDSVARKIVNGEEIEQVMQRLNKSDIWENQVLFENYYCIYVIAHVLLQSFNIYGLVCVTTTP